MANAVCDELTAEQKYPWEKWPADLTLERHTAAVRELFISRMVYSLPIVQRPLEEVNSIFCTHLSEGLFRMVCIRMLYCEQATAEHSHLSAFQDQLYRVVREKYGPICFDVLVEKCFTGFFVLLNYPAQRDTEIIKSFSEIFPTIEAAADQIGKHRAAICVGAAHGALSGAMDSKREVSAVGWSRRVNGESGVFFYGGQQECAKAVIDKLNYLGRQMRSACDTLSKRNFTACMDEFFALSGEMLNNYKAKAFLLETKEYMFNANSEALRAVTDVEQMYAGFEKNLWLSDSLSEYKELFVAQFFEIAALVSSARKEQKHPSVSFATAYIQQHYQEPIDINMLADSVNLSPVYFSSLFKRETGENFTEYLSKERINAAKKMLRDGLDNIGEVGYAVGFEDVRYFCKVFKKYTGCTPTAYRNSCTSESGPIGD